MDKRKIIGGVQHSVVGVIFYGDKVLMFKREGEDWETGWEFVKGAVHHGESEEQAILREVEEEAGVEVKMLGKLPEIYWGEKPYKGGKLKISASVYFFSYVSGQVKLGEVEHVDYKWMDIKEATDKIWLKKGDEIIERTYELYKSFK